jgi:hypothetical protein
MTNSGLISAGSRTDLVLSTSHAYDEIAKYRSIKTGFNKCTTSLTVMPWCYTIETYRSAASCTHSGGYG